MQAQLVLDTPGTVEVSEEELGSIAAPEATSTWFPISHTQVLEKVKETLDGAGFQIREQRLAVSRHGMRFFGTLDLQTRVHDGVALAMGIRNSCDRSFPLSAALGTRVFCCSNLCFNSEVVISRRHTRHGAERFDSALANTISGLHQYQQVEAERIHRLQAWELPTQEADSLILQSFEAGIISSRLLPSVLKHWRNPEFEQFQPRTGYSLENAFTSALGEQKRWSSNPQEAAATTMKLHRLLSPPSEN